jgi:hypothetical protein
MDLAIEHSRRVTAIGSVVKVLMRIADASPSELLPHAVWSGLDDPGPRERRALAAFYLDVVRLAARSGGLSFSGQTELRTLRIVLRLEEGDLLRFDEEGMAELVCGQIAYHLLDDRMDPDEALQQVALQQALGLSFDQYQELTARIVLPKVRALLIEAQGGLPASEFQRRLAALDSFIPHSTMVRESKRTGPL